MYLDGVGTPVNNAEAFKWTEFAAKNGDATGQNNLGHLYELGLGVELNLGVARQNYQLAADQGYQLAIDNLARLDAVRETPPPPDDGSKTQRKDKIENG
jgi:TPR repeat protein